MPSAASIKAGAAYVELALRKAKFESGLVQAERALEGFSRSFLKVGAAVAGLGAGLAIPFAFSAQRFIDFDDRLRFIRATTESTSDQMTQLEAVLRKLGRTTSFTLTEVGEAATQLALAGFDNQEIQDSVGSILDLARATRTDLPQAADIAAKVLRGFNIQTRDMTHVVDVLASTATGSAQTLEDLFESIKLVTSYGRSGEAQNLEEISAALGELANAGLTGSLAGTSLRRIFTNLATKRDEIKQLTNVDTVDANGDLRNFVEVLEEMTVALDKLGSGERTQILNDVFEVRGLQSAKLIGQGLPGLKEFIDRLKNSAGTAKSVAEEIDGGLGGAFRRLISVIDETTNQLGKTLAVFGPWLDGVNAIIGAMSQWVARNNEIVQTFALVAAGMVGLGASIFAIGVGLNVAAFAFGGYVKVIRAFESAIAGLGGVLKAVGAVIGGFATILLLPVNMIATLAKSVYTLSQHLVRMVAGWTSYTAAILFSNAAVVANRTLTLSAALAAGVYQAAVAAAAASSAGFYQASILLQKGLLSIRAGFAIAGAALLGIAARMYAALTATTALSVATASQGVSGGIALIGHTAQAAAATMTLFQRAILAAAQAMATFVAAALAKAISSLAAVTIQLGASAAFVQATVAKLIAAAGTNLITYLTKVFYIALSRITDGLALIGQAVGQAIGAAVEFFSVFVVEAAKAAARFIGGFVAVVVQGLSSVVASILGSVIGAIGSLAASIVGVLIPVVVATGAAFIAIQGAITLAYQVADNFSQAIISLRQTANDIATSFFELGQSFAEAFMVFGSAFSSVFEQLAEQFDDVSTSFGKLYADLRSLLAQFFGIGTAAEQGSAAAKDALESFKEVVRNTVAFISNAITTIRDNWDIVMISFGIAWRKMVLNLVDAWNSDFVNAVFGGKLDLAFKLLFKRIQIEMTTALKGVFDSFGISNEDIQAFTKLIGTASRAANDAAAASSRAFGEAAALGQPISDAYAQYFEMITGIDTSFERAAYAKRVRQFRDEAGRKPTSGEEIDLGIDSLRKDLEELQKQAEESKDSVANRLKNDIEDLIKQLAAAQDELRRKIEERSRQDSAAAGEAINRSRGRISGGSVGTFSAAAASRLGVASSISQQQLEQLKKMPKILERQRQLMEREDRKIERQFKKVKEFQDFIKSVAKDTGAF